VNESHRSLPESIDFIIPLYNEADAVTSFYHLLCQQVDRLSEATLRLIFVDDGSNDETAEIIHHLSKADSRIHLLKLTRNFGHQAAITAGLDYADAQCVITMDGDGQHPPELIPDLLARYTLGYDIVLTQRITGSGKGFFKRVTSSLYYKILGFISDTPVLQGVADYRLLSREVVIQLRQMREYHRYLRGMISWLGYRTSVIPYSVSDRIAGSSKYSMRKMVRLSMDGIFSFSLIPLYIGIALGISFLVAAFIEAVYVLALWFGGFKDQLAPGWSSLMFMLLLVGGVLMVMIGVVGIYIGYIFQEVKERPLYILKQEDEE
jgi:polyisoprenyl-phosphate glycosyltransferase